MELYRRQLGMIATAPLAGHGLGAFHDAHGPYKESPESHVPFHGESDWLETAVESGLLGWAARIRAASGVLAQRCVGRAMSEMRSYGNQGLYTGYLPSR